MKPPKQQQIEYERVDVKDFVSGVVEDVLYDKEHKFNYKGEEKIRQAVRIKFKVDG